MKTCIFCGGRPESKNRKHVIPQWLIKMTGDPNRQINLGADMRHFSKTGEKKLMLYSFNAFTFPACEPCNNKFSKLESQAKESIEKIFAKDYLSASEISIPLDWFDKVRIGLWLGGLKLDDIEEDVFPAFYINKRMGNRDRALFIYEVGEKVENPHTGLTRTRLPETICRLEVNPANRFLTKRGAALLRSAPF